MEEPPKKKQRSDKDAAGTGRHLWPIYSGYFWIHLPTRVEHLEDVMLSCLYFCGNGEFAEHLAILNIYGRQSGLFFPFSDWRCTIPGGLIVSIVYCDLDFFLIQSNESIQFVFACSLKQTNEIRFVLLFKSIVAKSMNACRRMDLLEVTGLQKIACITWNTF